MFDGLQPAQVTEALMPNLAAFAARGVTFANHHQVFPTVTRTNAATMVTGRHPGGHGLAGNTLVVPDFDPTRVIPALEPQLAQVARQTGRVLLAPTLAEILSRHGQEYVAVGVGTSGNALAMKTSSTGDQERTRGPLADEALTGNQQARQNWGSQDVRATPTPPR